MCEVRRGEMGEVGEVRGEVRCGEVMLCYVK